MAPPSSSVFSSHALNLTVVKKVNEILENVTHIRDLSLGPQKRSVAKRLYVLVYLYYYETATTSDFIKLFKSRRMLKYHIDFLEKHGLIRVFRSNHGSLYELTKKGRLLIVRYISSSGCAWVGGRVSVFESVSYVNSYCGELGLRFKVSDEKFSVRVYYDGRKDGDIHVDVCLKKSELCRENLVKGLLLAFRYIVLSLRYHGFSKADLIQEIYSCFRVRLDFCGTEVYRRNLVRVVPCSIEYLLDHSYAAGSILDYLSGVRV